MKVSLEECAYQEQIPYVAQYWNDQRRIGIFQVKITGHQYIIGTSPPLNNIVKTGKMYNTSVFEACLDSVGAHGGNQQVNKRPCNCNDNCDLVCIQYGFRTFSINR